MSKIQFERNSQYNLIFNKLLYIKKLFSTTLCKTIFVFAFRGCFFVYPF